MKWNKISTLFNPLYCSKCNTTISKSDNFCHKCGAQFSEEPEIEEKRDPLLGDPNFDTETPIFINNEQIANIIQETFDICKERHNDYKKYKPKHFGKHKEIVAKEVADNSRGSKYGEEKSLW